MALATHAQEGTQEYVKILTTKVQPRWRTKAPIVQLQRGERLSEKTSLGSTINCLIDDLENKNLVASCPEEEYIL